MYYSAEFNKPAAHVIVDLVNRTLFRRFAYNAVEVTAEATGFAGQSCLVLPRLWPAHQCRERASVELVVEGYQNALKCNYHKLNIGEYILHPTFVGDGSMTEEQILAQLQSKYNVFLDEETTTTVVFGIKVDDDTAWRGSIIPHGDHLVWADQLDFIIAPEHHIAHELTQRHLSAIDFQVDPDIAQEILEMELD